MHTDRYKNNPFLPKARIEREYTPEQIKEIIKCAEDPLYFAKFFSIVTIDGGLQPIKLHDYQVESIEKAIKTRRLIINASRQSGKTTVITILVLWFAMFNPYKFIALVSKDAAAAKDILKRIKTAFEQLPEWLKIGVVEWNKQSVEFENGSVIVSATGSADSIRGKSIAFLYIDEAAYVKNWEEFSASVFPTVSSGKTSWIVMSSTPNGLNHFYYYVKNAKEKKSEFELVEVPWWRVPGRDEKWKEKTLAEINFDTIKFQQEYELLFAGSSGTLISGAVLKSLSPKIPIKGDTTFSLYEEPIQGHEYAIIADVSRGKGLDYSAFSVIDITNIPYKQVYVFRDNLITPSDYANVLYRVGMKYNEALILVENNDLGSMVAELVFDMEYENIIWTQSKGRLGKVISHGGKNAELGIRTTMTVKNIGCNTLKLLIEEGKLEIVDKETIYELNTFSQKGKSWEAEPGKHDDLVMGLVLFGWMTTQNYFKELTERDVLKEIRNKSDEQIEEELLPFGFVEDGTNNFEESSYIVVDDF